ncbi:MAG: 3'(2'),5'-bisphosphate nucleotidase CysQ [Proteobacteria bacterium]|nr:3'(2'),5'-bisphosphate nucleotidase CysQ [Pseudomonadota bacterium]
MTAASHGERDDHALLCAAVREAGTLALTFDPVQVRRWDKGPGQVVTDADIAVNELLRERLTNARAAYGWLSEETADDGKRLSCARVWIVDPIDGTRAFLRGVAEYAICAALVEDGSAVAGAVLNPATGEFFDAVAGGGARCNGVALRAAGAQRLADATVLGSARNIRLPAGATGARFEKVHSVAYRMALVAAGDADAAVASTPLKEWDVAAAEVIVREAGGAITDRSGAAVRYNRANTRVDGIIAASAALNRELVALLRNSG